MSAISHSQRSFLVDSIHGSSWINSSLLRDALLVVSFNLVLIASAQISFPLPFSPVPITGQTFGILITALALGRVRATGVIALYLLEGLAGLPVFAGGTAGAAILVGPTGGYLIGFVLAGYVVGYSADKGWDRSYLKSLITLCAGTAIIFICGLAWLGQFIEGPALLNAGLYPYLPGAGLKILAAFWLMPKISKFRSKEH